MMAETTLTILCVQIWKACSDYAPNPKKAMTAFWGAQLRFFRQLVRTSTCMLMWSEKVVCMDH